MEKLVIVLLVFVIVVLLKKPSLETEVSKPVRPSSRKEKPFSLINVKFENPFSSGKGHHTKLLPVGSLEVITKEGSTFVPVVFDKYGQFTIGSDSKCSLVLDSPYIGAVHCSIEYDEESDEFVLFDNDSRNGIYDKYGKQVSEIPMFKGSEFFLAKCIHLRWCDYNAFMQIPEEDLPSLSKITKEDSSIHTRAIIEM